MQLSEKEIEWLSTTPQGLRAAADYHDIRETEGEAMGFNCTGNRERREQLLTEADRIQREWES